MIINDQYSDMVSQVVSKLKAGGKSEGYLDEAKFGEIKVFLGEDNKPKFPMNEFILDNEPVYVGSNELDS